MRSGLQERLIVIDGLKRGERICKAVDEVFLVKMEVIQRCQWHNSENIVSYYD